MKTIAKKKSEQNKAAVDPWTVVHLGSGLAFGLMGLPVKTSVGLALAYEVVEQYVERQDWGQEFFETSHPETIPNAIIDMVALMAGYWLGHRWNKG